MEFEYFQKSSQIFDTHAQNLRLTNLKKELPTRSLYDYIFKTRRYRRRNEVTSQTRKDSQKY